MFRFAWNNYKRVAYGADEIRPILCVPVDPFGGYSTTIVDTLDTLVVRDYWSNRRHVSDVLMTQ